MGQNWWQIISLQTKWDKIGTSQNALVFRQYCLKDIIQLEEKPSRGVPK